MSDSSSLYICIECEVASSVSDPVKLNEHGLCPRCGSSSVVPVDSLLELARKAKREAQAPTRVDASTSERHKAMLAQRLKDAQPLIAWLTKFTLRDNNWPNGPTLDNATKLREALKAWDGWSWHVSYPWDSVEENPYPGFFTIELVQGIKDGPRWFITLSSEANEVRSFQDGTVKP